MIVSYLQAQNIQKTLSSGINLGKLLLDFLGFYGQFDAENMGIYTVAPNKK
jgi:DNA polymerase sigma